MPIIDKTGKKKKYNFLVSGTLYLRGNYSFEHEVEAEDEEQARSLAESYAIEELDGDNSPSEYHDSTEYDDVVAMGEVEEVVEAPAISGNSRIVFNPSSQIIGFYPTYVNTIPPAPVVIGSGGNGGGSGSTLSPEGGSGGVASLIDPATPF